MDFQLKGFSKLKQFPKPEDGLRMVAERAPQAEALAASWIERARPVWEPVYGMRRRIATIAVAALACLLFVHVMFGANGMMMYRQKRAEYHELKQRVADMKQENDRRTQEIHGMKTDQKAIEREAREQLHYARPGEYVYVQGVPASAAPSTTHSAKK